MFSPWHILKIFPSLFEFLMWCMQCSIHYLSPLLASSFPSHWIFMLVYFSLINRLILFTHTLWHFSFFNPNKNPSCTIFPLKSNFLECTVGQLSSCGCVCVCLFVFLCFYLWRFFPLPANQEHVLWVCLCQIRASSLFLPTREDSAHMEIVSFCENPPHNKTTHNQDEPQVNEVKDIKVFCTVPEICI